MPTITCRWRVMVLIVGALAAGVQGATPAPAAQPPAQGEVKSFKPEELEQLVAPIALYPDSLLAQVLMASTYPIEVVQADRWAAENKGLKGDALAAALNKQDWDPSVKSLVDFPQVLTMMSKQLDWTTKLGDAFIADQAAVMDAAQRLRAKAKAEGNLKDTPEQKVTVEQAPPPTVVVQGAPPPPPQIITIQSTSPEVVYVPTYNPTVVYGAWPYPAYPPPPPYYPPGYVATGLISFGAGVAVGAAWGHAWGECDWAHGDVNVDVNRNANLNRSINRESYQANFDRRTANVQGNRNAFAHDPAHRKGVSYRDQASARKVGQPVNMDAAKARDNFRGRADTGRQEIARGGADAFRGTGGRSGGVSPTPARGGGDAIRGGGADRTPARTPADRGGGVDRTPARSPADRGGGVDRGSSPSRQPANRGGAFDGADRGGAAARANSSRGQMSRSASPSRSSPARSPSRGGGGGRAGGARGGGRR